MNWKEIKEKETYQKQNYKLLKDLKIKWMNWEEIKEQYQKQNY